MNVRKTVALAILGTLSVGIAESRATLLAYEGFNFTPTASLVGQDAALLPGGNSGFTAAYATNGNPSPTIGSGLSVPIYTGSPTLTTSAGSAAFASNSGFTGRTYGTGATSTVANGTYYYSLLFQRNVANARGYLNIFGSNTSSNGQLGFGIRADGNQGTPSNFIYAYAPQDATGSGGAAIALNTTYLVVGKIVINSLGTSTNTIWVNPDVSNTAVDPTAYYTTSAISSTSGQITPLRMSLQGRANSDGGGIVFDEVRVGTLLSDVVAVPEPASLGMLSLGAGTMLIRKRRA